LKKYKEHKITKVLSGSIAEELGIEEGDILLAINDQSIEDVFDYRYLLSDEFITLLVRKNSQEEWEFEIEKEIDEDLGLVFENELMDDLKPCRNKCVFCFIDQLPPHMRKTVYFKDDDWRMSFLYGNYITLTNMSDKDFERLLFYRLSPMNISVHATDPEVRKKMLNNRFAGDILERIKRIVDAGIEVNCQIVLCKGLNDGEILEKTIKDLGRFLPGIKSTSVVPVGISKFRHELYPLIPFEKEDARAVIKIIHKWQDYFKKKYNNSFIYAADEFYLTGEVEIPEFEKYEDFPQIENGVGMVALMKHEFDEYYKTLPEVLDEYIDVSIATGVITYPFICELVDRLNQKYPNLSVRIYPITNYFFGEKITVSGLMTGQDLLGQLKHKELGSRLLLPQNAFRDNDTILLDDMYVEDLEKELNIPITIVENSGKEFIKAILNIKENSNE
jgi:putative radical SAM enzyme (TIGR03279 family)